MPEKITIEDLAGMVAKGFDGVHDKMAKGFMQVDRRFEQVAAELGHTKFEDLMSRVKYLELKLGVESGK